MAKENTKKPLYIGALIVLFAVFFVILFFGGSQVGVDINYDINKDNVKVTTFKTNDYYGDFNVKIGEVKVTNSGILPKKVELDKFVLCQISDYYGNSGYEVVYKGKVSEENLDKFASYSYEKINYVEVSSGEEINLDLSPSVSQYKLESMVREYKAQSGNFTFYLFKVDKGELDSYSYYYNYDNLCSSKRQEDAMQSLTFEVSLDEEEYIKIVGEREYYNDYDY